MKKALIILGVILVILGLTFALRNLHRQGVISRLAARDPGSISRLEYKLYLFGLFPVGKASIFREKIEVYQGQNVYHLQAEAETSKALALFFSARAAVDSFVDINEFNPLLFRQRLTVKGKYDTTKEVFYDQKQGVMTFAGVNRIIPYGTKDPLAIMLYLKRAAPEALKDFQININTNQKTYLLRGAAELKEGLVKRKPHQFIILKADIRRRDKNPYHRSSITIHFLRNQENLPFRIDFFAGGVFLEAALTAIE